ncbi:DUF2878 domain-containing protein [Mangrovimicrobium sediminis]|uniref:DUF2878 domain-containing protein n=1 Tax=Mangrovimicrobium sediminis TaxID=2562682 RepID=A0A4Z0M529_9GAMM|nr:DUF2878 domain-containing protein [Haliea sp. SAOS-164]TGD74803.1 DUF2878 domain-containing protein [Haliea sp. SAOS-164]
MREKLANALMFNVSWLLIVLSQDAALAWGVAAVHCFAHLVLFGQRGELRAIAAISLLGLALDQVLFASGVLQSADGGLPAPLWMSALWPVFASTALHAFAGFLRLRWIAVVVGALGGYAAYRAGASLSAVSFGWPLISDLVLLAVWAALFPALLLLARQISQAGRGEGHV